MLSSAKESIDIYLKIATMLIFGAVSFGLPSILVWLSEFPDPN